MIQFIQKRLIELLKNNAAFSSIDWTANMIENFKRDQLIKDFLNKHLKELIIKELIIKELIIKELIIKEGNWDSINEFSRLQKEYTHLPQAKAMLKSHLDELIKKEKPHSSLSKKENKTSNKENVLIKKENQNKQSQAEESKE